MVWVRPGVLLVRAMAAWTRWLMRDDLPTLERPTKATSGSECRGHCSGFTATAARRARRQLITGRPRDTSRTVLPPRRLRRRRLGRHVGHGPLRPGLRL